MRAKLCRSKATAVLSTLTAIVLGGCPAEPQENLEHGTVQLQLTRGQSETDNPYIGTVRIEVTLTYLECLTDFYAANPDQRQTGPEGSLVFGTLEDGGEGWFDRLCDSGEAAQVDCTVERFRQELDSASQLTVTYLVEGDPEGRDLPFGPLPKPALAMCEAGGQPIVRVATSASVRGLDGNDDLVWSAQSFSPDSAFTDQGQKIKIRAARPGD
ncbi:MAG: hypothetical protein K0V04_32560 [Deltaproteobacteria bacterium]|nr:hypothetical protein [Deltaproteobacteria bacterium]